MLRPSEIHPLLGGAHDTAAEFGNGIRRWEKSLLRPGVVENA